MDKNSYLPINNIKIVDSWDEAESQKSIAEEYLRSLQCVEDDALNNDLQEITCPNCNAISNSHYMRDIHCLNPFDTIDRRIYIRKASCRFCCKSFTIGIKFKSYIIDNK